MTHRAALRQLPLLLYDELNPEERRRLEDHLRKCAACRADFEGLGAMRGILKRQPALTVDDALLNEARRELRVGLRMERKRPALRATDLAALFPLPRIQTALAGVALLAAGIVVGRALFPRSGTAVPPQAATAAITRESDTRITNVRFLTSGAGNQVEFTFDAVTPIHMQGSIEDPKIQKVLTHAIINADNPGVRLHAVSVVGATGAQSPDPEMKAALIRALEHDENDGVRREALLALKSYPFDDQVKGAVLHTLMHDPNPGLRIAAINIIDSLAAQALQPDEELVKILQNKIRSDNNNYIRLRARSVLEEVRKQ